MKVAAAVISLKDLEALARRLAAEAAEAGATAAVVAVANQAGSWFVAHRGNVLLCEGLAQRAVATTGSGYAAPDPLEEESGSGNDSAKVS